MSSPFFDKLRAAARHGFSAVQGKNDAPFTAASAAVLCEAAGKYDVTSVRNIITRWPEAINTPAPDGLTPLHFAVIAMDSSQIAWLVARGADINAPDHAGNTPLHFAAQCARADNTQRLVDAGARIEARNHLGETPLYFAVMFERPENLHVLVAAGARADAARHDGETPLSLAAKDDKQPPGGAPAARHDMMQAMTDALCTRKHAIDGASVLAGDMTLPCGPTVRKRVNKP
ncbi:MAG TPA: ankyrin repeat domain-containing protein [Alphaproteobacteria bacterium]|nr:hypothetical protein [Rhodospirillaceae bacterium]HRJ65715.1 ankyrin repeat domain-containing protein [Alphaproteobacteria bacterium]